MNKPYIEIMGVYRLPVTEDLFLEQFRNLYDYPMSEIERIQAEQQCRDQLASVVLIEALVHNRDRNFDVADFTQPLDDTSQDNWQAAWAEAYLSLDGEQLIVERWSPTPTEGDLRLAFFLHFWREDKPIRTSYGDVQCPQIKEMPERLSRLVPYIPMD